MLHNIRQNMHYNKARLTLQWNRMAPIMVFLVEAVMSKRAVIRTIKAPDKHWVGNGFLVHRMFDYTMGIKCDPFLLMDYAAPHTFAPNDGAPRGVDSHPHQGFETVTLAYQGSVAHQDDTHQGIIQAGDVQWMTAGAGVVHKEHHADEFAKAGGVFEMVQLWVNLPAKDKQTAPRYQAIRDKGIPRFEIEGAKIRQIAGDYEGRAGAAKTFSPIVLWDIVLKGRACIPIPQGYNACLLVRAGDVTVSDNATTAPALVVLDDTGHLELKAHESAQLLLLAGAPLNEPVVGRGPFVMHSKEALGDAFNTWRARQK